MSGLIQRLLDRTGAVAPATVPVTPAARSASPLAAADQRLHDPAFRDLGAPLPTGDTGEGVEPSPQVAAPYLPPLRPTALDPLPPLDVPGRATPPPVSAPVPPVTRAAPPAPMVDPIAALRAEGRNAAAPARPPPPQAAPIPPSEPDEFLPPLPDFTPPGFTPPQTAAPVPPAPVVPQADQVMPSGAPAPAPPPSDPAPVNARPVPPAPVVPEAAPLIPEPAASSPEPQPAQMLAPVIAPSIAAPDAAPQEPAPETQAAQQTVERIVERVLDRQPAPVPKPQVSRDRPAQRLTADSVSLIGALPQRRSTHTLFGLRRS